MVQRSREGNLSVEMCSHEFFLKHALATLCDSTVLCITVYFHPETIVILYKESYTRRLVSPVAKAYLFTIWLVIKLYLSAA